MCAFVEAGALTGFMIAELIRSMAAATQNEIR